MPGPGEPDEPDTKPVIEKNYKLETILIYSTVGLGGLLTCVIIMGIFVPLVKPKKKSALDDDNASVYSLSRSASVNNNMRHNRPDIESARTLLSRDAGSRDELVQAAASVDNLDSLDEAATMGGHQTDV